MIRWSMPQYSFKQHVSLAERFKPQNLFVIIEKVLIDEIVILIIGKAICFIFLEYTCIFYIFFFVKKNWVGIMIFIFILEFYINFFIKKKIKLKNI
jgi:hypothetical protein